MSAKKIIILSTHRSGSTWLLDMLRQHSKIQMFGEIFLDRPVKENPLNPDLLPPIRFYEYNRDSTSFKRVFNTWNYLNKVDNWREKGNYVGYKVMYNHLKNHEPLLTFLILKRYKILHLVRENYFNTVVSHFLLKKTGVSNVLKDTQNPNQETIYIPPQELLHRLKMQEAVISHHRNKLKKIPIRNMEVSYESLKADTKTVMSNIMQFLELNEEDSYEKTQYVKMHKKPYHEQLENFQEIQETLRNTPYFKYIDQ